jgi:hypothetical protein
MRRLTIAQVNQAVKQVIEDRLSNPARVLPCGKEAYWVKVTTSEYDLRRIKAADDTTEQETSIDMSEGKQWIVPVLSSLVWTPSWSLIIAAQESDLSIPHSSVLRPSPSHLVFAFREKISHESEELLDGVIEEDVATHRMSSTKERK